MALTRTCRVCGQPYTGSFHRNCGASRLSGAAAAAPAPGPTAAPAPDPTTIPAVVPIALPQARASSPAAAASSVQARSPAPSGQPPAPTQPLAPAAPAPDRQLRALVTHTSEQTVRRPFNLPLLAALLGAALILVRVPIVSPLLVLLILVGLVAARRILFRIIMPRGTVTAWNAMVVDLERQVSFGVQVIDPVGVPPEVGSQVVLRGRRRGTHFQATRVLRERDAHGNPTLAGDGYVARRVPPPLVGYGLLALGIALQFLSM